MQFLVKVPVVIKATIKYGCHFTRYFVKYYKSTFVMITILTRKIKIETICQKCRDYLPIKFLVFKLMNVLT